MMIDGKNTVVLVLGVLLLLEAGTNSFLVTKVDRPLLMF
jgi:hypothetical protein